ncbi:MAG: DUF1761 family protein [Bacteroidota bacterium]
MPFQISLNIPAIISSAFICFSLLALWFSPALFGNVIRKYRQHRENNITLGKFASQFVFVMLFTMVMEVVVDSIGSVGMSQGVYVGVAVWLLISLIHLSVAFRFDKNSMLIKSIYSGYFLVTSVISAALLSMWR